MRWCWSIALALAAGAMAQSVDVGSGSPTDGVRFTFVEAWLRAGFNQLVGEPTGNVASWGSTGLIQRFPAAISGGGTLALVKPDQTERYNVMQVKASMFAYYNTVGTGSAGFPTSDTLECPALKSPLQASNSCQWQPFSSNYALFTYAAALVPNGPLNFATRDPYFTRWNALGGVSGLGPASSAEAQLTSLTGTRATMQTFDQGAIFSITSGLLNGRLFAVKEPVYSLYLANAGHGGSLGVPTTEELNLANGMRRQSFEGGAIDYDPATNVAILRPPISRLSLSPVGSLQVNAGATIDARVTVYGTDGGFLTDRAVAWNTSNGRVVQIQAAGLTATLRAVGAGTAIITVSAEGRTSTALNVTVIAPCCQIGEGAPSATIRQAFQDVVNRNRLNVQLPAASPASRTGGGYAQHLLSTSSPAVPYLLTVQDGASAGYLVSGSLLAFYLDAGGPAGTLGYPLSDVTPGGRQNFQRGALAGGPVQSVHGAILAKWGSLGYETGVAGPPVFPARAFVTSRGATGTMQSFQNTLLIATGSGPAYSVSSLILTRYLSSNGPSGELGAPIGDERTVGPIRQQDFEGGSISYAPGASEATLILRPRQPLVTATPSAVLSGSSTRLVIGGFASGATVRVSQTGQQDFIVTVTGGFYGWDVRIPPNAPNGTVAIRAVDVVSGELALASYTIRNSASVALTLGVESGDRQEGAPGAQLAQPLVVSVRDAAGNPVSGQAVTFAASPGGRVEPVSAVTDADGRASAVLRLPPNAGIALATAQAARQVVTFSARSAPVSLVNFPDVTPGPEGALAASVAAIVRYHQLRGELPQPFGLADPAALNQFFKTFCVAGTQVCDGFTGPVMNLWRVGAFAANNLDVTVDAPDLSAVRDIVSSGSPALVVFGGSQYTVAKGVTADGSLELSGPATGAITGVVRLLPQAPPPTGFLVSASSAIELQSPSGTCGRTLALSGVFFRACDGSGGPYQIDAPGGAFTALSAASERVTLTGVSFSAARAGPSWTVTPLVTSIARILNAASFSEEVAPGGLISVFGAGLSGASVQVNGTAASVVAALPFQVNAQVPPAMAPGAAEITVTSANGSARQTITIRDVAPAIFTLGETQAAITNQDSSLNSPANPALRGSYLIVYGTGFGTVAQSGNLSRAIAPVTVGIGESDVPAAFAGLTPGAIGLYQANVQIPVALPPGLSLVLRLKQGAAWSNAVTVAIQ